MKVVEKDPIVKGFAVLNDDLLVFAIEKEFCEHRTEFMVHFISYSNTLRACGATIMEALSLLLHI
ncbi:hypothetical protein CR513_57382, partial [Mucuna pruriens]